jgi:cation transport ATPase
VAGAAIAVEAADVALYSNDLRALAPLVRLARLARRKIAQNIAVAVATKARSLLLPGSYSQLPPGLS